MVPLFTSNKLIAANLGFASGRMLRFVHVASRVMCVSGRHCRKDLNAGREREKRGMRLPPRRRGAWPSAALA